jgi:hypothetical protein
MSSPHPLLYGLFAEVVPDQCILISGKTFDSKDLLKSLGGVWVPDLKKWKLPLTADLSSLQPQVKVPPRPPPRTDFLGKPMVRRCCQNCKVMYDKKRPDGPLWFVCPTHGTWQSDYTID